MECDVTKFNQLNGAAWILPRELSSFLCVCEYLSKPFILINTVKGATSIEVIETMFCLWSFLIIFSKQTTSVDWKFKNDWTKRLRKIPRKISLSPSLPKRKLAEKNEWNLSNQSGEVTHASIYLRNCRITFIFFSVTLFRAWFYDNQSSKIKFNLLKIWETSQEHTRAMLVKLQSFIPQFSQLHPECYYHIASLDGYF